MRECLHIKTLKHHRGRFLFLIVQKTMHKPSEPILLAKLSVRFVSDGKLSSNHPNMFITIIISIRKNSGDKQQQPKCV